MPVYPIEVTAQELYSSSNTRRHRLGARAIFRSTNGITEAMYVRNNNSAALSAGFVVGIGASGWGYADTAPLGAASCQQELVLGGLAASLAASSDGGYGWVILNGPQTNVYHGATLASSAGARGLVVGSLALLTTGVTTFNSVAGGTADVPRIVAIMRPNSAFSTSGTGAAAAVGVVVDWLFR